MVMSRQIARAMGEQVRRVNQDAADQTIDELRAEIERLQNLLQKQQPAQVPTAKNSPTASGEPMMYAGRPVISVQQAALKAGVSYWIASRYVRDGWWKAVQINPRKYAVYEDQAFTLRPKRERAAKQSQPKAKPKSRRGKN